MRNRNSGGFAVKDLLFTLSWLIIGAALGLVPQSEGQVGGPSSSSSASGTVRWRFEVASIRPAPDPAAVIASGKRPHTGTKIDADRLDIGSAPLMQLIVNAYSVKAAQVIGPAWMQSERFDVLAQLPEGATKEQVPEMLRALLEERFMLRAHRESELKPVYALLVGPKGPKLEPPIPREQFLNGERDGKLQSSGTMTGTLEGRDGPQRVSVSGGIVHIEYASISTKALAELFGGYLGNPGIDMTGLQGTYHVVLDLSQRDVLGSAAATSGNGDNHGPGIAPDPPQASVFSAIEKLGLKVESRKGLVERLVIDHVEKTPTGN